ncbi:hypothetical protein A8139_03860 [Marinomonas primoryensis]|uniref:Uncharacterized protein n=2 Tax=Marinomonas primoryensis TaxID=178399 RepID=A0A2Z4PQB5_9GAMM|nr:hypothetical protein A8139_03860 [Marinomonas primoryensis]
MNENDSCVVNLERSILKDGPDFLSHKLFIYNDTVYIRPTLIAMSFCVIYIVVGCFLMGLSLYIFGFSTKYDLAIFLGGFGIAITTFGFSLIRPFLRHSSFNKRLGVFNNHKDHNVKLQHIVSFQINNKIIKRKHGLNYPCYELNLLTQHGRRINILNHNDLQQIEHDASLLEAFLHIEVRDYCKEIIL